MNGLRERTCQVTAAPRPWDTHFHARARPSAAWGLARARQRLSQGHSGAAFSLLIPVRLSEPHPNVPLYRPCSLLTVRPVFLGHPRGRTSKASVVNTPEESCAVAEAEDDSFCKIQVSQHFTWFLAGV